MAKSQAKVLLSLIFFGALRLVKAEGEIQLEALCSTSRAAVKWTASWSFTDEINLVFECTSSNGDVIWTNSQDICFYSNNQPLLAHTRQLSLTHVISKDLEPETTCKFTVHVLDRYENLLREAEAEAECTIGGSAASTLPAVCEYNNDSCECSCNPGFQGMFYGSGNTCEAVLVPTPSSSMVTLRSTEAVNLTTTGLEPDTTLPYTPSSQPKTSFVSSTATVQNSVNVFQSQTKQLSATIIGVVQSPTPTPSLVPSGGYSQTQKILLAMSGAVAIISITIVCPIIFFFVCTMNKQKRWHKQQTMPFKTQKLEKIDPDFLPENLNMNTTMIESESLHSILHTLHKQYTEKEANATDSAIESDTYSEKEEKCQENGEKGERCTYVTSSESSGYATEGSFFSESLMSETSTFISDSVNQAHCEALPQDYIIPVLSTTISFNFPLDM